MRHLPIGIDGGNILQEKREEVTEARTPSNTEPQR